jgi:mannose-1-phosphate guanylyltransferase
MDYAVIMAGGTGKRLWPLSRQSRPKQLLRLFQGESLLRLCFDRLKALFDQEHIFVLTNTCFADLVRQDLPELHHNNVIAEPVVRDTAGAIGLAASVLAGADPDATLAVVTADQIIKPTEVYHQALRDAIFFVNSNSQAMVTFGVQPSFPSTQLGYIKLEAGQKYPGCENLIHHVEAFKEKPDENTAKEYLCSNQYCWNSGMFVWKAQTILSNLFHFLPACRDPLKKIQADWDSPCQKETIEEWFVKLPKISIDFAVMEKAENVYAVKLACDWLDLGSFTALADVINADGNNNIVVADFAELLDSDNNIIVTEDQGHLIAVIGLEDVVVAHSPDATLVCRREDCHRLKELLELVKCHTNDKFL